MGPVIMTMLAAVGKILLSLLTSLLTEKFLKKTVIAVLEKVVNKTESDLDNQILAAAKEAWEDKSDAP
jgi:hypothetical protein